MKMPGLAIAIMGKKKSGDEEKSSPVKEIAGELFDAIKEGDKEAFVEAIQNLFDSLDYGEE
jgi:NTP pyrophosphatase (non-canonical NTP hydrolase)